MAGYYDKNKDYAAAIKKESDPGKKQQLISERQNKIDAMNASGTNNKGYTNSIYSGGSSSNKNNGSSSNKNNGSSSNKNNSSSSSNKGNSGYYDANKDYAAAIRNETDPVKRQQLIQERQNKLYAMSAAGTNKGQYTNDIYNTGNFYGGNNGYFDPNKDYAAAIKNAATEAERNRLMEERQNKIEWMNNNGTNTGGYNNSIYSKPSGDGYFAAWTPPQATPPVLGQYQNQDAVINDAALGRERLTAVETSALQTAGNPSQEAVPTSAVAQDYTQQTALGTDPIQQLAAQAYFARQQSNIDPSEVSGVYAGDKSLSLPDQQKLAAFQKAYNEAKAAGNQAGMDAAHKGAELIRDDYRYYPLAKSDGYGLGENNIGFVRDLVVRVDSLGNKYVDQYNRGSMTTTKYDADGNFVNRLQGTDIASHDARVAKEMQRTNDALERHGKENTTFAVRVSDPNDVNLSVAELRAKYGNPSGGMGTELYSGTTVSKKIPNGQTLASMMGGGVSGGGTNSGAVASNTGVAATGYFDPNLDYAAAIAAETDPTRMVQLMQERQNKIDWLNANGQNKGYSNDIYGVVLPQQSQQMQQTMMPEYIGMDQQELQDTYNSIADELATQRQNQLNVLLAQNQLAQQNANSEFDDIARQAYIARRQSEVALPQQLAAMGISGGGSETANLQLQTNYQNNLQQNEQARQQMANEFALQALTARQNADSDISGYRADAKQNALSAWMNEQGQQNSWNQWLAQMQMQQQQYQNELQQQAVSQAQAQRDFQVQMALQTGDYAKLAAMGYDTSYLKKIQAAELESLALDAALQRANINKLNRSVTKGSGGGNSSGNVTVAPSTSITEIGNGMGSDWINIPGYGRIGLSEIDRMIENGTVKETVRNGKKYYVKA